MAYIRDTARFSILDDIPADVWQENATDGYLCIVDEEPFDYHGSFTACTFTAALDYGEHVPVSAMYLRDHCTPADEQTARKILAFYIHVWADSESGDAADILHNEAARIEAGF